MDTHTTQLIKRGKKLSYFLRHDKSYAFDEHGWREVSDLVANHGFTMKVLREIVVTNNKQRYKLSKDIVPFPEMSPSLKMGSLQKGEGYNYFLR